MSPEIGLPAILESILFVHGEPLGIERLATIAEKPADEVREALAALRESYAARGLALVEKDGAWQIATHPAAAPYIEKLIKGQFSEDLSRAALETIAVVAYKGPLTRAEIEYIRGVNSSFTIRALLMRGLVERVENPKDARSYRYQVSMDFLKYLGLARIEDLPEYEALKKQVTKEGLHTYSETLPQES